MNWFVLQVKTNNEIKIAAALEKEGIKTFCPVQTEVRQWSDRKKKVEVPLFKSYVFVQLPEADRNKVFVINGVLRYLFWLNKPAIVRDEEITKISSWLADETIEKVVLENYKPGDEVTIKSGPLKDKKGVLQRIDSKYSRIILKDMGILVTAKNKYFH
ncbi:UpxY family transcription antiterminator [Aurantibacter sp.]|uniref:UpxY family transcription antiterminator n=1 Tax=Aurantibacter sp. TaxID=2807103 RepID=UPI003267F41E